jgi:hypothetical protein
MWDLFGKQRLELEKYKDIYWHDVDTISAVQDADYFIKKFNQILENKLAFD